MNVAVFDPTVQDDRSKVRGIGRYLQILRENFTDEFTFTSNFSNFKFQISNSIFINPFFNLLQLPLTMFRMAKKQVAVIHDLIPLKYPTHFPVGLKGKLNIFLNKFALRNYDVIITDSEVSKKDIIDILGIPEGKIKVVFPCLTNSFTNLKLEIRNLKSNSNDKMFKNLNIGNLGLDRNSKFQILNYCIYVGDATWNKNLVNIARAIKLADVKCVFVGKIFSEAKHVDSSVFQPPRLDKVHDDRTAAVNVWQKELTEFMTLAKDDKRFIFPGFIPDNELIKLYEQASLNILLSRDEGFGFSYVEAGSQGCSSLLADRPIFHEVAGTAAEFVDPENVVKIAEVIIQFINNSEKRKELGSKAQEQSKLYSQIQFKEAFMRAIS